jgi:hypothetical protein
MMSGQQSTGQRSSYQQTNNNQLVTPYEPRSVADCLLNAGSRSVGRLMTKWGTFCYTKGKA